MLTYLLYFSTFITGVLLFELVANAVLRRRTRTKSLNRRMALIDGGSSLHDATNALRLERGLHPLGALSLGHAGLQRFYTQSGLTMRPFNVVMISLGAGAAAALATGFFTSTLAFQLLALISVTILLPFVIMWQARSRRILAFTRQLPDAIDVAVRSLQAGHPFPAAVGLVAREMPDPIGSEFGLLADEMSYGIPAESGMANMLDRVGAEDLQLVIVSLSINRSSGGNLAEVLENLSKVIRERFLMKAKIRSLSAEGRFSAKIMSVFPLLLYFMILAMAPHYYDSIWEAGIEWYFFGFCVVMTVIGNIVIRRMVNLDF